MKRKQQELPGASGGHGYSTTTTDSMHGASPADTQSNYMSTRASWDGAARVGAQVPPKLDHVGARAFEDVRSSSHGGSGHVGPPDQTRTPDQRGVHSTYGSAPPASWVGPAAHTGGSPSITDGINKARTRCAAALCASASTRSLRGRMCCADVHVARVQLRRGEPRGRRDACQGSVSLVAGGEDVLAEARHGA